MKFVQITPDIINIREVTEPTNDEDDGWTVHGFVGNSLYTVFGGELSPSEQFQKHRIIGDGYRHIFDRVMTPIFIVMSVSWSVMEQ